MAQKRKIDWITVLLACTALVFLVLATKKLTGGQDRITVEPLALHENWSDLITAGTISTGPEQAEVTMIEFYNYGCGFCRLVDPALKELRLKYPDDLKIQYVPLHQGSFGSALVDARAAYCADDQQAFEPVHRVMFNADDPVRIWEEIATESGIPDADRFVDCVNSNRFDPLIEQYEIAAKAMEIPGVPYFIINGKAYIGSYPREVLDYLVEQELQVE